MDIDIKMRLQSVKRLTVQRRSRLTSWRRHECESASETTLPARKVVNRRPPAAISQDNRSSRESTCLPRCITAAEKAQEVAAARVITTPRERENPMHCLG